MKSLDTLRTAILILAMALWIIPEPVSAEGENPARGEFPIQVLRFNRVPDGDTGKMVVEPEVVTLDAPPREVIFFQDGEVKRIDGEEFYKEMEGFALLEEELIAQKYKKQGGGGDRDYKKFYKSMNNDPRKTQSDKYKDYKKSPSPEKYGDGGKNVGTPSPAGRCIHADGG